MNFLSFEWFLVLVGTVSLYWLFPERYRNHVLIAITAVFLYLASPESFVILSAYSLVVYLGTRSDIITGARVTLLCLFVFCVLAYYKITVNAVDNFMNDTVIPLGLSYYSFRCIHYVFERYRETLSPHSFAQFMSYMFFLPTIVVGPINRAESFFDNYKEKAWSAATISYGLERILYGYAKITILSAFVVNRLMVDWRDSLASDHEVLSTYVGVVIDGLDLYFLFSGYSDIAIGFAALLGYRIMENFRWPYLQRNISEFWRSWHISLSSWARDYVYFPVVGRTRNPYLGTLATFVVIGLWHEISMRYILWGFWHGVGILLCRQYGITLRRLGVPRVKHQGLSVALRTVSTILTMHYVWFGLIIVSEKSLADSMNVYRTILFGWWS